MTLKYLLLSLVLIMSSYITIAQEDAQPSIHWSLLTDLPSEKKASLGFAGMVCGVSHNVLIIAGGANFPEAMPWNGGKKFYSSEIFVLEKVDSAFKWNKTNTQKLLTPIAYAGCTTTPKGIVYVGGESEEGTSSNANILEWNHSKQQVEIKKLPDLPIAVSAPAVTSNGNTVFVICGDEAKKSSNKFYSIDLSNQHPKWDTQPDAPVSLANGIAFFLKSKIYLISGRSKTASGISDLHATTFVYDLKTQQWKNLNKIFDGVNVTPFTAPAAFVLKGRYIVLAGGDKGDAFHKIETLISKANLAASEAEKQILIKEKNTLLQHHNGFSTDVLLYDIQLNKWTKIGYLPFAAQVTTAATVWKNRLIIASGEIRPGVRSPHILIGKVKP